MKSIAKKEIYDNVSANQEIKTTQLSALIDLNKTNFKSIKAHLNMMKVDVDESVEKYSTEPETRVKKTVHATFTLKFREVLRVS